MTHDIMNMWTMSELQILKTHKYTSVCTHMSKQNSAHVKLLGCPLFIDDKKHEHA